MPPPRTGDNVLAAGAKPRKRRPARFKQADLARAVKGFLQAGLPIACARIELDGTIVIVPGAPAAVLNTNPWDA